MALNGEFWFVVGNSDFSIRTWDIKKSRFPLAYLCPPHVASYNAGSICIPKFAGKVMGFAGLAIELKADCQGVSIEDAGRYIAGCRLWIGLYSPYVIDELTRLEHQIRLRDHGIAVYYGQWIEGFHTLGDLMPLERIERERDTPLRVESSPALSDEQAPNDYAHSPALVVAFLSRFMTLYAGDTYALGALCGFPLMEDSRSLRAIWGDAAMDVELTREK